MSYTEIPLHTVMASSPTFSFEPDKKSFKLSGIHDINQLKIDSPKLQYKVLRNNNVQGEYLVNADPKGDAHEIAIYYGQSKVPGTPFKLLPKPAKLEFQPGNKSFSVHNIHLPEQFEVQADTLPFKMFKDAGNPTTFHVHHTPGNGIHDVDIKYRGETIDGGRFRLAPNPKTVTSTAPNQQQNFQGQPIMQSQGQMLQQPMMPQQSLYPPPGYYQTPYPQQAPYTYPTQGQMYAGGAPQYGGVPYNNAPQQYPTLYRPPYYG